MEKIARMEKIAFVKLQGNTPAHRIPATEIKQEHGAIAIYDGEQVVGRFNLICVDCWALELAEVENVP